MRNENSVDDVNVMNNILDTNKQQQSKRDNITCLVDRYDNKLSMWIRGTQQTRTSRVQAVCDACRTNKTKTKQCRELIPDENTRYHPKHYEPHFLVDDEHKVIVPGLRNHLK